MSKGNNALPLFETSAMDDINVDAAFDAVARSALRRGEQDDDLYVLPKFMIFVRGVANRLL